MFKLFYACMHEMFEASRQGIMTIGNVKVGEKTMLDAIHSAVEALKGEANKNSTLIEALEQSVKAAERGMESTMGAHDVAR